jgi:hypothetical protein
MGLNILPVAGTKGETFGKDLLTEWCQWVFRACGSRFTKGVHIY